MARGRRAREDLGGGGRYDRLFDRFELDVPAVGFGFNLARLAEATSRDDYTGTSSESVKAGDGAEALKRIHDLRAQGKPAIMEGGA